MKKIIIDDAVPYAKAIFAHLGEVICLPGKSIQAEDVKEADALIIRSRTQINRALLAGSAVQFVGSTVVGLDHVDQAYLKQAGIHFYSAQGCNANSVAEYILTALFNLAETQGFQLKEKSLAIIGVGHVGKLIQQKAEILGIRCRLNDPPRQANEPENADLFCDLDTALQADIITVHTPLTFEGAHPTHHLLSAERLKTLRPDQILINAARGGIIDETAWSQIPLQAKLIDCWENEPNILPELYFSANLATPHIAGHSLEAKVAGSQMVYHELCQLWQVTPKIDWQTELPASPDPIRLSATNEQSLLNELFQACYCPQEDDLAIREKNIIEVHKKYEYYRRHYPIHREWHQHKVISTQQQNLDNLLNRLGFTILKTE